MARSLGRVVGVHLAGQSRLLRGQRPGNTARSMRRLLTSSLFCLVLGVSGLANASAPLSHTVYAGQRLASIAKRYGVSVDALCAANGISRSERLRVGQKLRIPDKNSPKDAPALQSADQPSVASVRPRSETPRRPAPEPKKLDQTPRIHTVAQGQRLASIAKRYRVSVDAICTASGLARNAKLKVKQKLVIPGKDDPDGEYARSVYENDVNLSADGRRSGVRRAPGDWKAYVKAPRKRGYVSLVGYHRSWKGAALGPSGRVLPRARAAMSEILNASPAWPAVDARLVRLVVQLSDKFGGRELRIISGLRKQSYVQDSRHHLGRAVDLTIVGVPNEALKNYLLTLDKVGVGYYPNSSFVHLDVRNEKTRWVDYAGPGEPPRLVPRSRVAKTEAGAKRPELPDQAEAGDANAPQAEAAAREEAGAHEGIPAPAESVSLAEIKAPEEPEAAKAPPASAVPEATEATEATEAPAEPSKLSDPGAEAH